MDEKSAEALLYMRAAAQAYKDEREAAKGQYAGRYVAVVRRAADGSVLTCQHVRVDPHRHPPRGRKNPADAATAAAAILCPTSPPHLAGDAAPFAAAV